MKTILIAVSGISPAIITETLWKLADESPPVVPDEVVIITTVRGEFDISQQLLSSSKEWKSRSVWAHLRKDIFAKAGLPKDCAKLQISVRVIELPDPKTGVKTKAIDLRSEQDNAEAANFILQTLSSFTDAADHHVIASIAGGRKTMGALLYASMSLVAKESDRVTHVLVNDPFDTTRGFFYPAQVVQNLQAFDPVTRSTHPVNARDACIELADVPFVPLRNGFKELNEKSLSFGGLVARYTNELQRALGRPPRVSLDVTSGKIRIEEIDIKLTGRELLVASFLYLRAKEGKGKFQTQKVAKGPYLTFVRKWMRDYPNHPAVTRIQQSPAADDLTKGLSSLRKKMLKKGLGHVVDDLVPERSSVGFNAEIY